MKIKEDFEFGHCKILIYSSAEYVVLQSKY